MLTLQKGGRLRDKQEQPARTLLTKPVHAERARTHHRSSCPSGSLVLGTKRPWLSLVG